MIRIATIIGLLVLSAGSPVAAEVLIGPNHLGGGILVGAKESFSPRMAPPTTRATNPLPRMYWGNYYDCLETKTHLDCGTAMFEAPTPRPGEVTPGRVEEAVRRIGLPALVTHVQPTTRTLVNVDTIVYAEPAPFDATVPILSYNVRIHAVPTTYTWHFGDGTTTTTTDPGAPWPHDTVTHRYQRVDDAVPITLTVGYEVTYSTDGTPWEDLEQPINATGPATTIAVDEAHAILIAP